MSKNRGHPQEREYFKNGRPKCGAKTRSGKPCQQVGHGAGNRCRKHGGASTGAPKGNKNATTHGRFEQIMFSSFTDEEKELIENTELDPMKQIDDELKIIIVREKRMLERYKKAQENDYTITQIEETQIQSGNRQTNEKKTIKENNDIFLHKMETELNKVQNMKLKLLAQKAQLEAQRKTDDNVDISKVVDAISNQADNVWNDDDDEE
jgi:uncharacterized protein YjcR